MGRGRLIAALIAFLVLVGALWGFILYRGVEPQLGLDLQGGVSITLIPAAGQEVDSAVLDQTVEIIRQRVDGLGVAEPDIARQGDTIEVQLPGITDQERAQEVIGRTAQLQFRPVLAAIPPDDPTYGDSPACDESADDIPAPDEQVTLCEPAVPINAPEGAEETPADQRLKYLLGPVAVSGEDVADASAVLGPSGVSWQVDLGLDDEGEEGFEQITGQLACAPVGDPTRELAIVLDGVVESHPPMADDILCDQGIPDGQAIITVGGEDEARELALVLRTGALPIELDFATSQRVSPTLGRDSLNAGLLAGALGLLLVAVYVVVLYRGIGIAAVVELAVFGFLTVGLILLMGEYAGFTLTLAGIAGLIVSIGIAADSSIIYRERFRDELLAGRTIRTAADHAFTNAWRTNLTGNAVSFLAALVLYVLAVGPVRGFAFTLGLSTLLDTIVFGTFTRSLLGLIARTPALARSRFMGLQREALAAASTRAGTRAPAPTRRRSTSTPAVAEPVEETPPPEQPEQTEPPVSSGSSAAGSRGAGGGQRGRSRGAAPRKRGRGAR
jgi:preprotein translocase subunit SecD